MNFKGELSERSKVPHSKCGLRRIDATWVRIPCSPFHKNSALPNRQRRCFCIDLSFMPTTIIISAAIGHIALFTGITVPTVPCVICPVPFRTVSMLCVTVSAGRCPFFFAADIYVPFHIGFLRIAGFVDYVAFLPYNIRNAVPAFVILEFRCLSFKFFISKYKFMYCLLWLLLCPPIPPFFLIHTPRPVSVFHLFSFLPFPEVPPPLPW